MWSRQELKEKAKKRIKPNYWRTVLVSLILLVVAGSVGSSGVSVKKNLNTTTSYDSSSSSDYSDSSVEDFFANDFQDEIRGQINDNDIPFVAIVMIVIICMVIFLIIFAIALAIQVLLFNPLAVGCNRYFVTNLSTDADIKEICYTYDKGYKNGVKVMFFRSLYTFLWSLLFVIPGIIKSYEYRMIPYLLGEHPDMDKETAFALSRQMMTGNKWNAFVLDLSFILWYLLSALTCGILNIFYVNPYVNMTNAALYVELRDQMNAVPEEQLS